MTLSRAVLAMAGVFTMTNAVGQPACANQDPKAGQCRDIRARVTYANGNPPVRIWPVGTTRILGVRDAQPPLLPEELGRRLSWDHAVYGDLRVCPLTKERPGHMQIVCVAAARNLSVAPK